MPDKPESTEPKTIEDIVNTLDIVEANRYPTIEYYLGIDIYFKELKQAISIIREYSNGTDQYDLAKMNNDLLVLAALHVSTAELVGYVQGYARRAEDNRKITKSRYGIGIKSKKSKVSITDADIDNGSRVLAKDTYIEAADAETISSMTRLGWYAIGDFVKILNSAINRSHQELYMSKKD